jgi:hypothetical protein
MSSEISTERVRVEPDPAPAGGARPASDSLHSWQLFTLAGLIGATVVVAMSRGQSLPSVIFLSAMVFAAALVGLAALRTLAPLVGHLVEDAPRAVTGRARAALDRDKALALRAIKELEFDRAMGKVSERDFDEMSARLRARAARLIRQLDAGAGYRDEIEREVARRLAKAGHATNPKSQTPHPSGERSASIVGPLAPGDVAVAPRACAGCQTLNDADARFCKHCGKELGPDGVTG